MQIVALDGAKLLALMLAGGGFAVAGLWLMFRPQPAGEAARIELFGLKFQASSAGLLVFLIGAAFLAVPIFVPERAAVAVRGASETPSQTSQDAGRAGNSRAQSSAIQLPAGADVEEQEPNDAISSANALTLGQTVSGSLVPGDLDWFVFSTEPAEGESIRVTFRNLGSGCPQYEMFNSVENRLYAEQVCSGDVSKSRTIFIDGPRHFLRVNANGYRTRYEVFVGPG